MQVAPDADELTIRRAYTRLLKQTNPEDNPAGFQELRAAYEAALAQTARRVEKLVLREADESEDGSTVVQAETKHEKAANEHSAHYQALQDAMTAALQQGDRLQVLDALRRSQRGLDFSLMEQHAFTNQVMLFLTRDSTVTAAELEAIIKEFGWQALASAQDDSLPAFLLHRLEGLKWYEKTILAPTKGWFRSSFGFFVNGWSEAKLLQGQRDTAAICLTQSSTMRPVLGMLRLYYNAISDRFREEDVEYCFKFFDSPPKIRWVSYGFFGATLSLLFRFYLIFQEKVPHFGVSMGMLLVVFLVLFFLFYATVALVEMVYRKLTQCQSPDKSA